MRQAERGTRWQLLLYSDSQCVGCSCGEYDSPALAMTLGPGFTSIPKLATNLAHPQSSKTLPTEDNQWQMHGARLKELRVITVLSVSLENLSVKYSLLCFTIYSLFSHPFKNFFLNIVSTPSTVLGGSNNKAGFSLAEITIQRDNLGTMTSPLLVSSSTKWG